MLNLLVAMLQFILLLTVLFQSTPVSISSPQAGAVVRGQVEILGSMDVPTFASAELAFGYISEGDTSNPADNWFIIQSFPQPKAESALAVWDTTSVTDGDYILRLRVFLQDGTIQDAPLISVKVSNDTPEPTATMHETLPPTSAPVVALQSTAPPTIPTFPFLQPTSPPPNPASLTVPFVYATFGRGALIALGVFLLFSIIIRLRKN
jgi:hypothetical protein